MSNPEASIDHRKVWVEARRERAVSALADLVTPLLDEHPRLKISAPEIIHKLSETTGIVRALLWDDLRAVSDSNMPIDGDNRVMKLGHDRGQAFFEAQLIENPIQSLDSLTE